MVSRDRWCNALPDFVTLYLVGGGGSNSNSSTSSTSCCCCRI